MLRKPTTKTRGAESPACRSTNTSGIATATSRSAVATMNMTIGRIPRSSRTRFPTQAYPAQLRHSSRSTSPPWTSASKADRAAMRPATFMKAKTNTRSRKSSARVTPPCVATRVRRTPSPAPATSSFPLVTRPLLQPLMPPTGESATVRRPRRGTSPAGPRSPMPTSPTPRAAGAMTHGAADAWPHSPRGRGRCPRGDSSRTASRYGLVCPRARAVAQYDKRYGEGRCPSGWPTCRTSGRAGAEPSVRAFRAAPVGARASRRRRREATTSSAAPTIPPGAVQTGFGGAHPPTTTTATRPIF